MGSDKALLEIDGRPMIVRVADALWEAGCHPVACQGGDVRRINALGLDVVPDTNPDAGPVEAIRAALEHHCGPVLIAACDLVDLDPLSVRAVIEAGRTDSTPPVSVATADGCPHLLSYWSAKALDPLTALIAGGVTAYHVAIERLRACPVPVPSASVRNVNRPEDLP
jgi:molybdopterin-guanine dinucleotide biosynthesis protein A